MTISSPAELHAVPMVIDRMGSAHLPRLSLLLRGVTEDGLQLKEFFESSLAPLSAVAGLFVAAETTSEVDSCAVDVYVTCSNAPCHPACALCVSRCHETRQPVRRVVRNLDRVIFGFIRDDAKNGSEDFFARDGHVIADIREYRRLHKIAF